MRIPAQIQMTTRVSTLARDFLRRPEFQPRDGSGKDGRGGTIWLPAASPLATAPDARVTPPDDRRGSALTRVIGEVAEAWSIRLGEEARGNLERLAQPGARVVVAGQQPGLLTGPLLTIYKAVSAVGAARHLEARTGVPHVPVFWVASEDHDLDEVRGVALPGPEGETISLEWDRPADRRPLSAYRRDDALVDLLDRVSGLVADRHRAVEAERVIDAYRGGPNLAASFAASLADLFAPWGLLVIEPEALREAGASIVRRALEQPSEVLERIRAGAEHVVSLGRRPRVAERFPLFMLEEGEVPRRHHLEPVDGRFRAGHGETLSTADALELLERSPHRFSTAALLRPVVQQSLLPVALAVLGPAEIDYFDQLGPLLDLFDVPAPPRALRLSATLIEGKVARAMERVGVATSGPALDRLVGASRAEDLVTSDAARAIEERLARLAATVEGEVDAAMADAALPEKEERRARARGRRIVEEVARLEARLRRSAASRSREDLAAAIVVWNHLFPDGVLQERRWNVLHYLAKYGAAWLGDLVAEVERDPFVVAHRWAFM